MHADDLDVLDRAEGVDDLPEATRRQHKRITAGEDHFPDFAVGADIGERGGELLP